MRRAPRLCCVLVIALLGLAGCGSDDSAGNSSVTRDPGGGTTIEIVFKGDTVTPEGASIKVAAGKPIRLHIVADKPGELHVHSTPEHEIEYPSGTTDETITIDQPGVVEMESHTLEKPVAQLEVR